MHKKTKTKILAILLVGLFIWVIFDLFMSSARQFESIVVHQTKNQLSTVCRSQAQSVQSHINTILKSIETLSSGTLMHKAFRENLPDEYFRDQVGYSPLRATKRAMEGKVDMLYRIDRNGIVQDIAPFIKDFIGEDFSRKPGVDTVLKERRIVISGVYTTYTFEKALSLNYPVFDDHEFIGLLRAMIFLDTFNDMVKHIAQDKQGYAIILDAEGVCISHPDASLIGQPLVDGLQKSGAGFDRKSAEKIVRQMKEGWTGGGFYRLPLKEKGVWKEQQVLVSFAPIKLIGNRPWSIAVTRNYRDVEKSINGFTRRMMFNAGFFVLMMGVALVMYYWNYRRRVMSEADAKTAQALQMANDQLRQEIKERQRAEQVLKQSEEDYRTLVNNVNVGIYRNTAGPEGRFLHVNPTFVKIFGYDSSEEVLAMPVKQFYPNPLDRKEFVEEIQSSGFLANKEMRLLKRDGTAVTVSFTAKAKYDDQGKVEWIDGVIEDITERKKMEEELRENEERYRMFLNSTDDVAFLKDEQLRYLVANKAFERLLGRKSEEIIGKTDADLFPAPMAAACRESDLKAMHSDTVVVSEELTGETVFESRKFLVRCANKILLGGYVREVSHKKKIEAELQRRMSELERFNRFAVDRELKMVELKNKIRQLEETQPEKELNV